MMLIINGVDTKTLNRYSNEYLCLLANVHENPTHKKYSLALIFPG